MVNPYIVMPFGFVGAEGVMTPEYRGLISLYREGLESRSPVYQFLCLFKIASSVNGGNSLISPIVRGAEPRKLVRDFVSADRQR